MRSQKKLSLSDTPLEEGTSDFGTDDYVKGLERFITRASTPITIALQGEWGSGKTSLMNRLNMDLCGDGKIYEGISINTWEYSMLSTPEETVIKIIGQLIESMTAGDAKAHHRGLEFVKRALYRFGREWLKGLVPGGGYVVEAMGVPSDLPADKEKTPVSLRELKKLLTDTIANKLSSTGKEGILIFIDDLDRLSPPLAVQILELLKNLFTIDGCIFILAIDYEVVVKGLEPKFGKLNESNEREFRSFFDKIIQVPFLLPVNNYKPMKFILNSLVDIEYISSSERSIPYVERNIEKIVESSVGKNPRSIKRLINTLSLLDCIDKSTSKNSTPATFEMKIITFAIVALQVCYKRIYDVLSSNPDFSAWDRSLAIKLNLRFDEENAVDEVDGDEIIDIICQSDPYLARHQEDIYKLLKIINDNAAKVNAARPDEVIRGILDRASTTSVNSTVATEELDRKSLITKLHENVWAYISRRVPDMKLRRPKRNTGNGGYLIELPDGQIFEVVFHPCRNERNSKVSLEVSLIVAEARPERLTDLPYKDVISDPEVAAIIKPLDDVVRKYIEYGMIESITLDGRMFNSLYDEYLYRADELWNMITGNTRYWFNLTSAADYEDHNIIAAIGDLIIGAYNLKLRARGMR